MEKVRYIFRGDRLTRRDIKGAVCHAVKRPDGKCIRGRNSNMLVEFEDGTLAVIPARRLKKIKDVPTKKDTLPH